MGLSPTSSRGGGGGSSVSSVFGRTGAVVAQPNDYPQYPTVNWLPLAYVLSTVGTWISAPLGNFGNNLEVYNSTHAQDDAVTWDLLATLPAGTYTLQAQLLVETLNAIGTFETSPDSVTWTALTTIDGYAASTSYPVINVTGLVIAAPFRFLRVRLPTRNASATDWYYILSYLALGRTA